MKKRMISALVAAMSAMSLVACSSETAQVDETTVAAVSEGTVTAAEAADVHAKAESYRQYVTLGDYTTIKTTVSKDDYAVTDDDVMAEVDTYRSYFAETNQITEGVVESGDTVNMDYAGYLDGVAFSGGTATDVSYTVGSGQFIDDLDQGLIGLTIGQEYDIPCTFPENYSSEDLAGKEVIFKVTVNYVEEKVLPDYDDAFVATLMEGGDGSITTTAELEADIRSYLEEDAASSYNKAVYNEFMTTLLDMSEISGQDETDVAAVTDMIMKNAEAEFEAYGSYYGVETFESYITDLCGYESMDAFNKEIDEYAREYCNEKMIMYIISDEQGITLSEEDLVAYAGDLLADVNEARKGATYTTTDANGNEVETEYETYASVDALAADYGDTFYSEVAYELLYTEFFNKVVELATN